VSTARSKRVDGVRRAGQLLPRLPNHRCDDAGAENNVSDQRAGPVQSQDGALLGTLSRLFVQTVHAFYSERAADSGVPGAKTGSVTIVQRTSWDLRLNPHLHVVFLDGTYHEQGAQLSWEDLGSLKTQEVGQVLERTVRRIDRHLRRAGLRDSRSSRTLPRARVESSLEHTEVFAS